MGSNSLRLYHVHGKADKGNIVLGVEDNAIIPKDYSFLKMSYDSEYKDCKKNILQIVMYLLFLDIHLEKPMKQYYVLSL
ncbi:hypothetical protein SAMN05216463_12247 [Xylanibacter ruminicola]|uniref:Uncharacterized protein n=2 Tax=Xylanibacter ruminicola TaxID=839 RepID=A0A1M6XVF0_XYLRU|nr:hypothetical protein SAMN05216463_12247 [Xylanibacter ruminicola]